MSLTSHAAPNQALELGRERLRAEFSDMAAHRVARCAGCGEPVMATDTHVCAGSDVLHSRCAAAEDAAQRGAA